MDIIAALCGLLFIVFCAIAWTLSRRRGGAEQPARRVVPRELPRDENAVVAGARRAAPRAARVRLRAAAARNRAQEEEAIADFGDRVSDDDDDDDQDRGGGGGGPIIPEFDEKGSKIGTKKRKKLEAKAERRAYNEWAQQEREEKKRAEAEQDERRRRQEEKERQEEEKRLEAERIEREEKEQREHEEYLKLKESFQVEEEGYDEHFNADEDSQTSKLNEFIDHIRRSKIVPLEDLAARFKLKIEDCIQRVRALEEDGSLSGVFDERGKFIYIGDEEMEAVAEFIKRRGRLTIAELCEQSNRLISLEEGAPA